MPLPNPHHDEHRPDAELPPEEGIDPAKVDDDVALESDEKLNRTDPRRDPRT